MRHPILFGILLGISTSYMMWNMYNIGFDTASMYDKKLSLYRDNIKTLEFIRTTKAIEDACQQKRN